MAREGITVFPIARENNSVANNKRRIAAPWPTNINYINIWPRMRNPLA